MKKWYLPLLLAAIPFIAVQGEETIKLSASKHNSYGLTYSLPRTVVEVEIVSQRTLHKAGPYYRYAEMYLGVKGAIEQDTESWELKDVTLRTVGVPDTKQQYLVQFGRGTAPYMQLTEDGVLLSVNTEPLDAEPVERAHPIALSASPLEGNSYLSVLSEEMLRSGSEARMAEVAAKKLYRIRESRIDLITGDADQLPADGKSYELILEQLAQQEEALTALFMGTTQTEQVVERRWIDPTGDLENEVFFRFSNHLGVVDATNLAGVPVYLTIAVTLQGEYPINEKGERLTMPKNSLAYCIPGKALVAMSYNGTPLVSEEFLMAQFGIVYGLSPGTFDNKKTPAYVRFVPETGAISEMGQ